VRDKLREWKCPDDKTEKVISSLISEGFLDDERYARAFASGKFRINRWGMVKIRYELERRRIPANIIQAGLEEIDEEEYEKTLAELLTKKNKEIKDKEPFKRKQKLIAFAVQKGYEYDTIRRTLESIF
jgi:regulatory protein